MNVTFMEEPRREQTSLVRSTTTCGRGHFSRWDYAEVAIVLFLCGLFAYFRWLKIDSLAWRDPARWLFECSRVANGEIPYRDFSWVYPPFAVLFFGYAMKWVGIRFFVAEILVDLISLIIVATTYVLTRLLLPKQFRLAALFLFITVCVTTQTKFNLFSFSSYVPSLETGAAGCLIVLIAMLVYLRTGVLGGWAATAIVLGSFIAGYSKPESLMGTWVALVLLAGLDRYFWFAERPTSDWVRHYGVLLTACAIPLLVAYLCIALVAGSRNVIEGVTGYGLASHVCPWWPTGLGLFGAVAALGQASVFVTCLALTRNEYFATKFGPAYGRAQIMAIFGGAVYIAYFLYLNWNLFSTHHSWTDRVKYSIPTTLSTNAVLIPVMWLSICWFTFLIFRTCLHTSIRGIAGRDFEMLLLLSIPVVMSLRGLFNTTLDRVTEVSAICYPFFLILGPYLLWRIIEGVWPREDVLNLGRSWVARLVVVVFVAYGLLRLAGAYDSFSNRNYGTLHTQAGDIRSRDYKVDAELYNFVMSHTSPTDTVLDVPYGGGINVASGRRSPLFTTQFQQWTMPEDHMWEDLARFKKRPPKVVIAENEFDYGASYGLEGSFCAFPDVVWVAPDGPDPGQKAFPVLQYIRENYHVDRQVGPKLILVPNR